MEIPSETIQVALITLISGIVGALVGTFGVIWSSNRTAKTQMQKAVIEEFFKTRIEAYRKVLELRTDMEIADMSRTQAELHEIHIAFSRAIDVAVLVASPETAAILLLLRTVVLDKSDVSTRNQIFTDALVAMGEDLTFFKQPRITANLWTKRRRSMQLRKAISSLHKTQR